MVVVVAVTSSDQTDLAIEAGRLAEAFDDELHVLHVLDVDVEGADSAPTEQSKDQLREVAMDRARNAASELTRDFEAVGLVGDRTANRISEYADETDARYLVVGGRKRSPTGKAIFGSTTQSVLLAANCPVLTVMQP